MKSDSDNRFISGGVHFLDDAPGWCLLPGSLLESSPDAGVFT